MVKDSVNSTGSSGTKVNVPAGDGTVNIPYTAYTTGGKMGWICPQCGRSINPDLNCCPYCNGYNNWRTTSKSDKIEITW